MCLCVCTCVYVCERERERERERDACVCVCVCVVGTGPNNKWDRCVCVCVCCLYVCACVHVLALVCVVCACVRCLAVCARCVCVQCECVCVQCECVCVQCECVCVQCECVCVCVPALYVCVCSRVWCVRACSLCEWAVFVTAVCWQTNQLRSVPCFIWLLFEYVAGASVVISRTLQGCGGNDHVTMASVSAVLYVNTAVNECRTVGTGEHRVGISVHCWVTVLQWEGALPLSPPLAGCETRNQGFGGSVCWVYSRMAGGRGSMLGSLPRVGAGRGELELILLLKRLCRSTQLPGKRWCKRKC